MVSVIVKHRNSNCNASGVCSSEIWGGEGLTSQLLDARLLVWATELSDEPHVVDMAACNMLVNQAKCRVCDHLWPRRTGCCFLL